MIDERQPTEADWRLVAGVMGWTEERGYELLHLKNETNLVFCYRSEAAQCFDPLHDHNDLARLVEAVRKADWILDIQVRSQGYNVGILKRFTRLGNQCRGRSGWVEDYQQATYWAIVEALKAKDKCDG